MTGTVFHVQRFSIHDGPGIRSTVFLKGCPLRCFWCHNPEGIALQPQILFHADKCMGCGACLQACPNGVHRLQEGHHVLDRKACTACGACVAECFGEALELAGRRVTVEQVMQDLLRDEAFYRRGGGVTLSGGEPLIQIAFSRAVLAACKERGIHTAVETCGDVPWRQLESVLPYTDLLLMDLKLFDSKRHEQATGRPNKRILQNAARLASMDVPLEFRTPVIPTVNDRKEDIVQLARLVVELRHLRSKSGLKAELGWKLLGFHPLAGEKYNSLGLLNAAADLSPLSPSRLKTLRQVAARESFV